MHGRVWIKQNYKQFLLHLLLSPIVFFEWLVYFVSHRYFISALVFLIPFGVIGTLEMAGVWLSFTRHGRRFYLVFSGYPVVALFLLFALSNHCFLIIPLLGTLSLLLVVPLWKGKLQEYPARVLPLTAAGLLCFSVVVFGLVPTSRSLELQLYGEKSSQPLSEILSQPGVKPILTATIIHPDQSGRPRTLQLNYFDKTKEVEDQFDPYMIQWKPPGVLYVSYERRHRLERLDLMTKQHAHLDFDHSISMFFFDEFDPPTCYTGHSFSSEENSVAYQVDCPSMLKKKEFLLSEKNADTDAGGIAGFRTGFSTSDDLYIMQYNCDLIRLTKNLVPVQRLKIHSMICNYVRFVPRFNSAYLTGTPCFLHRVDIEGFRLANSKFLLLPMWVEAIPGRDEIAVNGFRSVKILDSKTLKTLRMIPTKTGIRCLAIDEKRNLIYVAQYFKGELAAYDLYSGQLKSVYYLGQQIRVVHYAEQPDRIYTGSFQGIFEIDPDAFVNSTSRAESDVVTETPKPIPSPSA